MARLRWRDVDLEHGRVSLEQDKTDDPRDWNLRPDVVEALKRWKQQTKPHTEPSDCVFAEEGMPLNVEHLAEQIRNDLRRVGVERSQLYEGSDTRQRFRAHDLRATFVTIALATGKTETWVSDRTGHDGHSMIERYRRKARTWNLGVLEPLYALIAAARGRAETTVFVSRASLPSRVAVEPSGRRRACGIGSRPTYPPRNRSRLRDFRTPAERGCARHTPDGRRRRRAGRREASEHIAEVISPALDGATSVPLGGAWLGAKVRASGTCPRASRRRFAGSTAGSHPTRYSWVCSPPRSRWRRRSVSMSPTRRSRPP